MGLLNRLFGGQPSPAPAPKVAYAEMYNHAVDVASAYGDLLQSPICPVLGASTADVSVLPYSKDEIRGCLKFLLVETKDPHMREMIKRSYVLLALFQEGVGPRNAGLSTKEVEDMVSQVGKKTDPQSFDVNAALEQAKRIEENLKWQKVVQRELATLQADINRF